MASYDDPNFVKALKLLHSPASDSAYQLIKMLEDTIEQKHGPARVSSLKLRNWLDEPIITLEIPKSRGSRGPSPILLGPSEKSSRSSTPPSEPVSIRTTPDRDDGDLALEIFEDDLFCTICKDIRVTVENRLLECTGCHSLYHQECHKPPVENADDPQLVWKCSDCTKKMGEKSEKSSSSKSKSSEKSSDSSSKKRKTDSDKYDKPSKRDKSSHSKSSSSSHTSSSGSKHSSSTSGSSSSKSESRSSKSSSSSSSLSFSKPPGSPNGKSGSSSSSIMAADKRLQNMKKKAAAKMQEKRSSHK